MDRRHLLKYIVLSTTGLLLPFSQANAARLAHITDIRLWTAPDHTRVVFDLDSVIKHSLFMLSNPYRLVVDLKNTQWKLNPDHLKLTDPVVGQFRTGTPKPNTVRIVFDLKTTITPRSFILGSINGKKPRLVVDMHRKEQPKTTQKTTQKKTTTHTTQTRNQRRDAVIVVDPGHGGEDPGAIGSEGTLEKHIALMVGKKLVNRLNNIKGFKAYLTRKGDYYVSLRQRVSLARHHGADLFISLHADAFKIASARGASVYCLSERGKPSPIKAIRILEQRENSADLIGGVDLDQVADPEVRGILMDLSQRDSLNRALAYGNKLLASLKKVRQLHIHYKEVKQAGFAVLKAPDMPSVLVELAFLSNKKEERMLQRKDHQDALAKALADGTQLFIQSSNLA